MLCLAAEGVGRRWDLYPERPGASFVALVEADAYGLVGPVVAPVEATPPVLRVDIRGPIEETAGYADECGAWYDGNDAIAERLIAAFAQGDVLLCVHSPGGNPSLAPEGMRRVLEAKAAGNRRCLGHVEGMAASLGFWWLTVIADEVYASADARLGSVGARCAHGSVAGALAQEGVAVTFSAWPNDGKTALVPELPLSALGKARNDRDAALCGVAFAAAVAASAMGMRNGLTVESLAGLSADVLTGAATVGIFTDGLATLESVAAYALESAGTGPGEPMTIKATDPPPKDGDKDPQSTREPGTQPDAACKGCGMENRAEAKFCDQCGASMAAEPVEPPASDPKPKPGAPARAPGPMLASVPALRTDLGRANKILTAIAAMVGARDHGEILGAVEATVADAGKSKRYREERNVARVAGESRERMDLLVSLYTADPKGHPRGKLVVDVVGESKDGKPPRIVGQRPAAQWSDGAAGRTIANLRAYARTTLAGLTTSEANPFTSPPAETDEGAALARVTDAHVAAAGGQAAVRLAVADGIDPAIAAESYARRFGALPAGVPS